MDITTNSYKRVDVVKLKGRLDGTSAPQLETELKRLMDDNRFRILIDLSDVTYISSAGVKVLLGAVKAARRYNRGDVRLVGASPKVKEVFNLAGLDKLFIFEDDQVSAIGNF
ncbi:MAG: STAS domain-containing protein [Chloroflexi bacterium]|nr:STAS domain-containing protein [Chloroflexota bacterium]